MTSATLASARYAGWVHFVSALWLSAPNWGKLTRILHIDPRDFASTRAQTTLNAALVTFTDKY